MTAGRDTVTSLLIAVVANILLGFVPIVDPRCLA
jgi:hypothetical protein